jgi:hypothetical protein
METKNNNEPKQQRQVPSQMEYREMAHWKVGEDIITVVGGEEKKPIAYIKLEKYDDNKKPVLSCRDLDSNALFENTSNLYELKRDLKDREIALTQAMQQKEQQQVHNQEQVETPAVQSKVAQKIPDQEKGNELKKVRRTKADKSKEPEQTISH